MSVHKQIKNWLWVSSSSMAFGFLHAVYKSHAESGLSLVCVRVCVCVRLRKTSVIDKEIKTSFERECLLLSQIQSLHVFI